VPVSVYLNKNSMCGCWINVVLLVKSDDRRWTWWNSEDLNFNIDRRIYWLQRRLWSNHCPGIIETKAGIDSLWYHLSSICVSANLNKKSMRGCWINVVLLVKSGDRRWTWPNSEDLNFNLDRQLYWLEGIMEQPLPWNNSNEGGDWFFMIWCSPSVSFSVFE
jgi:hypothetical protein